MQRREFIKNTGKIGAGAIILNGIPIKGLANGMSPNFTCNEIQDRIHVMVNLFGANDTLNTVIPIKQHNIYSTERPLLKIAEASTIKLDTSNNDNPTNLHPIMTPFKALYDAGKLNVVHGIGYADNNRSHFKSDDLWNTAGDTTPANFNLESGWAGQLFENRFPGLLGNTTPYLPDPPCIELGSTNGSILFQTSTNNNASVLLTNTNISSYYNTLIAVGGPAPLIYPNSDHGIETKIIDDIQKLSNSYGLRIQTVFNAGSNSPAVTYPTSYIASQLKTVARLIKGGSKSNMYMVHQYGYDTHGSQIESGTPLIGQHTNLLKDLTEAIKAFQDDITLMGFEDRIITTTHSEFGRTIDENSGLGTDHGGVSTMFIIGKGVKPGITGTPIDLTKVDDRALTDLQFDYRRVWSAVLQDFMGNGTTAMTAARMQNFITNKAPIIATSHVAQPSCYINQIVLPITLVSLTASLQKNGQAIINWETASEFNCKAYDVEHSTDNKNWKNIGVLKGSGNSSVTKNYNLIHDNPLTGKNYYRLWQIDLNGSKRSFGPIKLNVKDNAEFIVKNYPNPANFDFNIAITSAKQQNATIHFYDIQGHLLKKQNVKINAGFTKLNFLTSAFNGKKGEIIIHLQTDSNLQKTLRQIILD